MRKLERELKEESKARDKKVFFYHFASPLLFLFQALLSAVQDPGIVGGAEKHAHDCELAVK